HHRRDVRLVEQVRAIRRVVVGRERDLRTIGGGSARDEVLIEAIVVADRRPIAEREPARTMLDGAGAEVDLRADVAEIRVSIERAALNVSGSSAKGRDATIGG